VDRILRGEMQFNDTSSNNQFVSCSLAENGSTSSRSGSIIPASVGSVNSHGTHEREENEPVRVRYFDAVSASSSVEKDYEFEHGHDSENNEDLLPMAMIKENTLVRNIAELESPGKIQNEHLSRIHSKGAMVTPSEFQQERGQFKGIFISNALQRGDSIVNF
jgi:hypothetical protein